MTDEAEDSLVTTEIYPAPVLLLYVLLDGTRTQEGDVEDKQHIFQALIFIF